MIVRGEEVVPLPERALWWPAARTVVVADLHWGKEEVFHAHGIPVPRGALADDLARLERVATRLDATRVLVLGDLVHGALAPSVIASVATWRARFGTPMTLVRGNHDRHAPSLPESWGITEVTGVLEEGPFAFRHDPEPVADRYVWAGHLHPMVTLRGPGDRVRLPCFHVGARLGVLPAFGTFTGGIGVRPAPGDSVFAVAEGQVVALGACG